MNGSEVAMKVWVRLAGPAPLLMGERHERNLAAARSKQNFEVLHVRGETRPTPSAGE